MKKMFASKKSRVFTALGAALVLVVGALVGVFVYYGKHALPGTTLAGEPVSGMTSQQVTTLLDDQLSNATVEVAGLSEPAELVLADAGVEVDVPDTVEEVFAPNGGFSSRVLGIFQKRDVEPVVVVKQQEFDAVYDELSEDELVQDVVDGEVVFDEGSQTFVAQPSQSGHQINKYALQSAVVKAARSLDFSSVEVNLVEYVPNHTEESIQQAANQANAWLATEVHAVDREEAWAQPDLPTRLTWVDFDSDGYDMVAGLDKEAVTAWVNQVASESNEEPVPGLQNVNSAGEVVAVASEGADGYKVSNVDTVVDGIVAAFDTTDNYVGEFNYEVVERPWEQRLVADGAENLAYAAAPGEKWIDVNLSTFTTTAYEGATEIMSAPLVPGGTQYRTPTGRWPIYAKLATQTMRGNNADGSTYETPNVPWILYYDGGYALHGAYWRSSFGYDAGSGGSHGCINLPVSSAKSFYDWANVGDNVVVHY